MKEIIIFLFCFAIAFVVGFFIAFIRNKSYKNYIKRKRG